jgi:hypothetical protein
MKVNKARKLVDKLSVGEPKKGKLDTLLKK